MKGIIVLKILF